MLKIFHAPRSRSLRIVWLCEEMGVPYESVAVNFRDPSPEFLAVNPLRSLPVMQDGEVSMIESVAMMLYIMAKYGPTDLALKVEDPGYPKYLQFLMFGEAGLAMYGNPLVATKFFAPEDKRDNWTAEYLKNTFARRLAFVETNLGDSLYITGNRFTAADISVGYSIGMAGFAADIELSPKLKSYHERLKSRPAYQRAAAG
jgi:glutathione S-transferase/3-isopropylmalate dehydratase